MNLGSKRLILAGYIRSRSWTNIGDSYFDAASLYFSIDAWSLIKISDEIACKKRLTSFFFRHKKTFAIKKAKKKIQFVFNCSYDVIYLGFRYIDMYILFHTYMEVFLEVPFAYILFLQTYFVNSILIFSIVCNFCSQHWNCANFLLVTRLEETPMRQIVVQQAHRCNKNWLCFQ